MVAYVQFEAQSPPLLGISGDDSRDEYMSKAHRGDYSTQLESAEILGQASSLNYRLAGNRGLDEGVKRHTQQTKPGRLPRRGCQARPRSIARGTLPSTRHGCFGFDCRRGYGGAYRYMCAEASHWIPV